MADARVLARIDAWAADGLIDAATADRLRRAEGEREVEGVAAGRGAPRTATVAALFGPGITVGEMFAYLGGGFLLAAWCALIGRLASDTGLGMLWALGAGIVALVLVVVGLRIRGQSARFRRAAGVAFAVAGTACGAAAWAVAAELVGAEGSFGDGMDVVPGLAGAATWLAAAVALRRLHPSLLTQSGLVAAVILTAGSVLRWIEPVLFGPRFSDLPPAGPESPVRPIVLAIGWGLTAVVLGLIGLAESRSERPGATSRAGVTRVAAGLTAVLGTAGAVFASGYLGGDRYDRLIPPVIGDAALIAVSAVLLERAFRRRSSAFVYPAALGVVIGLSDLNAQYLGETAGTEVALLVEGVILLAAGVGFDRLRRRVGPSGGWTEDAGRPPGAGTPSDAAPQTKTQSA